MDFTFEYEGTSSSKVAHRVLGSCDQPIKPDLEVPNPLLGIEVTVQPFRRLVEMAADINEPNFTMPEQLRNCPEYHEVMKEYDRVMKTDYVPLPVKRRRDDIAYTMSAPYVSFINKELKGYKDGFSVLIIGAGVGKDLVRIMQSEARKRPGRVVMIEPDKKRYDLLCSFYPDHTIMNGTVRQCFDGIRSNGPYDLIVANMSIHYVLGVESGRSFADMIPYLLTPTGHLFGSYVDVNAVKQAGLGNQLKYGHSVMYCGEEVYKTVDGEKATNGIARISMGGKVFHDPWLDTEQYYELFEWSKVSVNIYDGTQMIYGTNKDQFPLYPPPPEFMRMFPPEKKRGELNMYRAIIVSLNDDPMITYMAPSRSLRERDLDGMAMRYWGVSYNKGTPLSAHEQHWIANSNCWVAEKKDGIMGKLIHCAGKLELVIGERVFSFHGFTSIFKGDFILQVEVMNWNSAENRIRTENSGVEKIKTVIESHCHVVVTDILLMPTGKRGSFLSRWRWLENVFVMARGTAHEWPFSLQEWFKLSDPRVMSLMQSAKEGVVFQTLTAPPGAIIDGAGSARYLKRKWTVDVWRDGEIWESDREGNWIRPRPDKTKPNPHSVIQRIMNAVEYSEMALILFYRLWGVFDRAPAIKNLAAHKPFKEWDREDLIWFIEHMHDSKLNAMFPVAMHTVKLCVVDAMQKYVPEERRHFHEIKVISDEDIHFFPDPPDGVYDKYKVQPEDIEGIVVDHSGHDPLNF